MKKTATYLLIAAFAVYALFIIYKIMKPFTYFSYKEFDSPDLPNSGKEFMSKDFIHKLDKIRQEIGEPMKINSGFRTQFHNQKVGGVSNSSHKKGLAADIAGNREKQIRIAKAAIKHGINRFGFGSNFIHLDIDREKTPNTTWGYGSSVPSFADIKNNNV